MKVFARYLLLPIMALGFAGCDVQQTEEGNMPEVNVKGGNMPEYDVDAGEVNVEEKEVTVPTLDYESPSEQAAEERRGAE